MPAGQVHRCDFETPLSSDGVGQNGMVLRGSFVMFVVNGNETSHERLQSKGDVITRVVRESTKTFSCCCARPKTKE